jgi:pimeloyl-ACP methyl ester carboxylesterase
MMPPVQRARTSGIELAYYEAGPRRGVPIILCHGFPELAFSWRHQLKALGEAGRWVIAPDQRGYGLSSRPDGVTAYDMDHLTGDLCGLLDHLGVEKAIFCGHDWGGIVVWQMPLMHRDRVAGVIGLNTPFMARAPADPIEIMRKRFGEGMYIVHFQKPGEADAVLNGDVAKAMGFFMRRPAPQTPPASGGLSANFSGLEDESTPASTFALIEVLKMYDPSADPRPELLSKDEMAAFVETFERTGFTGGINWYRNFTRNWERSANLPQRIDGLPCLMITAELDAVLPPSAAEHMPQFIGDLETHLVKGSGHWTQQEKPQDVNRLILDWLDRRFPR